MDHVLLSIILPVYNVEKYLEECIQSVSCLNDTNAVELLLVDDGSTDNSGNICDYFSEILPNCHVYHKANGGLSDARNHGLRHARGKYVFFLDSDDLVQPQYLTKLLNILRDSDTDILLWDAELVDEQGVRLEWKDSSYYIHAGLRADHVYSGTEAIMNQLADHNDYVTTVPFAAYRREMLLENGLWFEKSLLHEDELWTPKALLCAQSVQYFPFPLYLYRIRQNSIMTGGKQNRSRNLASMTYIFVSLQAYYDWKITDLSVREKIQANLTKRYLHKLSSYNAFRYKRIRSNIPKWIVLRTARGLKDRIRALTLLVSGRLYCWITKFVRE